MGKDLGFGGKFFRVQVKWLSNNGLDNDALGIQITGAFIVGLIHLVGYEELIQLLNRIYLVFRW
jgi:hypothetical protein